MSERPTVTIITPIYNVADMIQRTLDSVRAQDYPYIEHIVMDAGSTDGTLDILRANEAHLQWFSEPDKGQSDALNKGFARATGTYLTWLNGDDCLRPAAISRCLKVFEENPGIALASGRTDHVDREGNFLWDDSNIYEGTLQDLLRGDNFIAQAGNLFTREAWEACGPFSVELKYCMDWDLWIKIMERYRIKYSPQVFAAQAIYPETQSTSGGLPRFHEIRAMLEGHGGGAAHTYYKIGRWHYEHNQMQEARRNFWIGLGRGPKLVYRKRLISLLLKSYLGVPVVEAGRTIRARLGK